MKRYKIIHRTYYNYETEITLGTHQLLLRPREDHELRIESFILKTTPDVKIFYNRDVEDNSVAVANFNQRVRQLLIESEVIIQQYNESPLDFLVSDYAVHYPFVYTAADQTILSPYMILPQESTRVMLNEWIFNLYKMNESVQTYTLLQKLAKYIFTTLSYNVREEPGVQSVEETLLLGSGSCRDFASLFMEAAKCLGLASRFVSGYLYAPLMIEDIGSTHAWAEVYIPGAGWKGFDPTIGDIVGSDHIAVAVARLPESIPPIAGSFSGNTKSELVVGVWVSLC
mgnify:CR=1 FL=1